MLRWHPTMLTDMQCWKAKTDGKRLKLAARDGLYLDVTKNGVKSWRMRYRLEGKDLTYTFGKYPDISVKLVSDDLLPAARANIRAGRKPDDDGTSTPKAGDLDSTQFEAVAREWFALRSAKWVDAHAQRVIRRLEADIFPVIGGEQIANLTPRDVLKPLQAIEARGSVETAHKTRQYISMVFGYAIACEYSTSDPTQHLKQLMKEYKNGHFAAITDDTKALAQVLRAMHSYSGSRTVAAGLKLVPWLLVRPGELRKAQWSGIDLDESVWRFTITKTETAHVVPLPSQAVDVLRELQQYTGGSEFVFLNPRSKDKPMSENALQNGIKSLGFGDTQTAHGFRATARTMLDERLGFRVELIEHQLGHVVRDPNGRAYNRTTFIEERREMLQAWASWLDGLRQASTAGMYSAMALATSTSPDDVASARSYAANIQRQALQLVTQLANAQEVHRHAGSDDMEYDEAEYSDLIQFIAGVGSACADMAGRLNSAQHESDTAAILTAES